MKLPTDESISETEAQMQIDAVEGKITEQETHKPEDVAAAFFKLEKTKFQALLAKMAPYQLRRAIMNAVSYPFVDKEYNPETEEEKQFAYLTHELMLNKTIMQLSFEMQQAEKVQQEALQQQSEDATITSEAVVSEVKDG